VLGGSRRGRRLAASVATAATAFAAAAATAGCSAAPPGIAAVAPRLVLVSTDPEGGRDERLSLFASVSDGDGVADIEYLYVVHDGEELCWSLTPENWRRSDEGAGVWIGANSLDAPGPAIPRGAYRVIAVDMAGERAELSFSLSAPETSAYDPPRARLSGTAIALDSGYPSNTAFFYDSGGNVAHTASISNGETPLDTLWPEGRWRSGSDYVAVYGFEPKAEIGFFSWKIRLPD